MAKLQGILSTPEGMQQLSGLQQLLTNSSSTTQAPAPAPLSPFTIAEQSPSPPGLDMSAISSILSGLMAGGGNSNGNAGASAEASAGATAGGGGLDMSAISSMLSGLMGGSSGGDSGSGAATGSSGGLGGLLSGGGIDMNTILKLQQVFSAMNHNDKNTQLLYALKPHFSTERQAKVDQAVSILRLLSMLPAIKESGIFTGL